MGETERASSKKSAPLRPTINLPPRASFDTFFTGGPGFSPGPMTLISNLFSPEFDCRSFTQLLAGAMASPAASAPKPNFLPYNSTRNCPEEAKNPVPGDGSEKNLDFKQNNRPMNLMIPPLSPIFTIPSGLSPSGFLNSPGLFSPFLSPFGISHQQALAHVTAQAALLQYRQSQTEYQPQFVTASTEASAQIPFAPSATSQPQVPTLVSEPVSSKIESSEVSQSDGKPVPAFVPIEKPVDDGYNWRKYGQKQVKASEYPRSYYKCTHANCPVKKKVERSSDRQITEIIYKGHHNHDQPRLNKRPKDGEHMDRTTDSQIKPEISSQKQTEIKRLNDVVSSHLVARKDQVTQLCDDVDAAEVALNEEDADEPSSKRRIMGTGTSDVASSHKPVTEPKITLQTRSEVDLLDDGYKWRKYGQKVVKGNPYPRCTYMGCNVRKHVERARMDPKAVITTYEGKHNHDIPAGRNIQNMTNNLQSKPQRLVAGKAASREEMGFRSREQKHDFLPFKEEQVTA